MKARRIQRLVALIGLVAGLSGCATGYLLDSQVKAFSRLPPAAVTQPLPYRFERLLSQQQAMPQQDQLEAWAERALQAAGLLRNDAAPRYSVQVTASVRRVASPWADPWKEAWGAGGWHAVGGWGWGGGWRSGIRLDPPWFEREVSVIVRELASQAVVFESHARSDGPILNNQWVIPALFDMALQGFPTPPSGLRQVQRRIGGP